MSGYMMVPQDVDDNLPDICEDAVDSKTVNGGEDFDQSIMNPMLAIDSSSSQSESASASTFSSVVPSPSNDNDEKGEANRKRLAFIDPEDVIGRRVTFGPPPLMMDTGWGSPTMEQTQQDDDDGMRKLTLHLPGVDEIQNVSATYADLSESPLVHESDKHRALTYQTSESFSSDSSAGPDGQCEIEPLSILMTGQDYSSSALRIKPCLIREELYEDVFFLHWNWPVIRCICKLTIISVLVGFLCIAIALVATAPRTCEPPRGWWQGAVIYEVFPASFRDSDGDGVGDLTGLRQRLDYISNLGVTGIRLNSIMESSIYPRRYWSVMNHSSVDPLLGDLEDFRQLIEEIHSKNMRIILDFNAVFVDSDSEFVISNYGNDFSIAHVAKEYPFMFTNTILNGSLMLNLSHVLVQQMIQNAMTIWLSYGIDGFYMKYLEYLDVTPQIQFAIIEWRSLLDRFSATVGSSQKILISSGSFADRLENRKLLRLFHLVEYEVKLGQNETDLLPKIIEKKIAPQIGHPIHSSPYVLWILGSAETPRLASRLGSNYSLAAIVVQMMLPGSVSIFYGDEILLKDRPQNDERANLVPMQWNHRTDSRKVSLLSQITSTYIDSKNDTSSAFVSDFGSSFEVVKRVVKLRNTSTPLLLATLPHNNGHEITLLPNYKVRYCDRGIVVLERFYPRYNSFVVVANLGETTEGVDLLSTFYQGNIVVSTNGDKSGDVIFRDVKMKSGEAFIARL